ncbi:TfoX/Sxy family protein [Sinisalibacter lacisalsi]|uniref:Cold-shock protein n=1 Tax=Sinisalibacter lacisalsi TaxID=1526570 RepID=A0ABQ1QLC3_9RHOB|nr:TfoX/Sxy family protein [Sinisalibacter lacisalsi]GGD32761.1 cold-shock protein [Sinisalibacter lacisalsi]
MSYDEGLADLMRSDLADTPGIAEKRMFGGIAFMLDGNMLCGVHPGAAMFRVGKDNEPFALAIPGARQMALTGRRMGGFVEVDAEAMADETRRTRMLDLAFDFVRALPAK